MIKWIVGALVSPFVKLGEKYLENEGDKEKLKHGSLRVAVTADSKLRGIKWSRWVGRFPLFVAEIVGVSYYAAVMIDSGFPSEYLNPLELPEWFKPHFQMTMLSVFGINTIERWRK